jgi:hypothetical protein
VPFLTGPKGSARHQSNSIVSLRLRIRPVVRNTISKLSKKRVGDARVGSYLIIHMKTLVAAIVDAGAASHTPRQGGNDWQTFALRSSTTAWPRLKPEDNLEMWLMLLLLLCSLASIGGSVRAALILMASLPGAAL